MYQLAGVAPYPGSGRFRGPPVTGSRYIACVGAAQTFGCFCAEPYPALLAKLLGIETMNLGYGGAGPTFHNSNPRLLKYINDADLVIVQVMSARSQSNTLFRTRAHARRGIRLSDGAVLTAERFYHDLVLNEPDRVAGIVEETRENYVENMLRLLQDITPPKILFWFSVRRPEYTASYQLPLARIFGGFPQLVNRAIVDRLRAAADRYVECVTSRGMPQPLFDRQGRPSSVVLEDYSGAYTIVDDHNRYYPSPEMHADAAAALVRPCGPLIGEAMLQPRPRCAPPRAADTPEY
jgi:hypothetical protein